MLKDKKSVDETSSHFSYNEYKKKSKNKPNQDVLIFTSIFIVGVLIILGFAKILSPNVDVGITVDDEISNIDDSEETTSSVIDERLQKLKNEDEDKKADEESMFSPELDEKVVVPNQKTKTVGQMEAEKYEVKENLPQNTETHTSVSQSTRNQEIKVTPQATHQATTAPVEQTTNAKVVVGYYATEKQAEVAKSIMQEAGLGLSPVVKNLGGYFTLQVGSYSTKEKAQQAANSLLKNNFPARVITE
jgi:cell division protein FtsN